VKRIENPVVFSATVVGVEPHVEQVKYLLGSKRTKILVGGRRSGKTTALALEIVYSAVRAIHEGRPFDQLLVAPSVDQARLLFNAVSKLLRSSPLGALIQG
jgi:phage terminase large subunit-like protein